ncbi:MAG: hypothetical protein WC300_01785 [Candidatus Omnitrophota bacterium]|jgi:vacuolar-type H+-ATPase subunit H
METDLRYLIDKIKQDGVDQARAEASKIIDAARAQADEMLKR